MSNIYDCADSFSSLLNKEYHIILGKKGKTVNLRLVFFKKDCYHLIGLHYLKDRPNLKKDRELIFDLIRTRQLSLQYFESSDFYESIKERLDVLANLETFLDSNDIIFKYSKYKTGDSKIDADYLMCNKLNNKTCFVFLSNDENFSFCRSCFPKKDKDYTKGQERWTLLYKEKINLDTGVSIVQYQHPSYKTPMEQATEQLRRVVDKQNTIRRNRNRDCR